MTRLKYKIVYQHLLIYYLFMKEKYCLNTEGIIPFLKTISDENRLKILCFLKNWDKCVCEIVKFMNIPQNLVSHHLKKLKIEEILISRKEWLNVIYSINHKKIDIYLKNFNNLF